MVGASTHRPDEVYAKVAYERIKFLGRRPIDTRINPSSILHEVYIGHPFLHCQTAIAPQMRNQENSRQTKTTQYIL